MEIAGFNIDVQVLASLAVIVGWYILHLLTRRFITTMGGSKGVPRIRAVHVYRYLRIILLFVALAVLSLIWGVGFSGMLVFASSVFAVVGVALFAQWSIISNITSGVIIFFSFPARIGNYIRVVDGDNTIEGRISEITLFQILLSGEDGSIISYPSNLLLQKPVMIYKKGKPPAASGGSGPEAQS